MLRDLVRLNVPRYLEAKTKTDKGVIIIELVQKIRRDSPTGTGLVRQDPKTERWHFIGHDKAKDKIGHALRKASHQQNRCKNGKRKRAMSEIPSFDDSAALEVATEVTATPDPPAEAEETQLAVSYEVSSPYHGKAQDTVHAQTYAHHPYPYYYPAYPPPPAYYPHPPPAYYYGHPPPAPLVPVMPVAHGEHPPSPYAPAVPAQYYSPPRHSPAKMRLHHSPSHTVAAAAAEEARDEEKDHRAEIVCSPVSFAREHAS